MAAIHPHGSALSVAARGCRCTRDTDWKCGAKACTPEQSTSTKSRAHYNCQAKLGEWQDDAQKLVDLVDSFSCTMESQAKLLDGLLTEGQAIKR